MTVQTLRALRPNAARLSLPSESGEEAISGGNQAAAAQADQFLAAYKALRADPSLQFDLVAPPPRQKPPAWLEAVGQWLLDYVFRPIGKLLKAIGSVFPDAPYAQILLWTVLALAAAALGLAIFNRVRHGAWRLRPPRRAPLTDIPVEEQWLPEQAPALSWLEEADEFARQGRYADAVHQLLFRSIDDIARRRPKLIRPALTSREIAGSHGIPARARDLFTAIAGLVERSLFGGRPVAERDWLKARQAYSDFALPRMWQR